MTDSLQVLHDSQVIFRSSSHWLYPLFELEDFLEENSILPEELYLHDKIAGRAAAALIARLGIKRCHIDLLSQRGEDFLLRHEVEFSFDRKVERIDCRTEEWIESHWNLQQCWLFLKKRAGRVKGASLKIENISCRYDEASVLEGLNLEIGKGDQLVIQGDNGAGKTTLLKTILGLHPLSDGTIELDGMELGSSQWRTNRHICGYLPQGIRDVGYPISVMEVVSTGLASKRFSAQDIKYRCEIALRQSGAFHLIDRTWDELSGGERQRVSLARCLCQQARILLIDEPTSYLDQSSKDSLIEILNQLVLDITPTILLVSHDQAWVNRLGWPVKQLSKGQLC